jgi:hypothetical protein
VSGSDGEDDRRKLDLNSFWQIMGKGQGWELMAESIAVDGKYAYTGQDIELTLLET